MERDYKAHEREHAKYGVLEEAEVRGRGGGGEEG
jgi:hypothetical protein